MKSKLAVCLALALVFAGCALGFGASGVGERATGGDKWQYQRQGFFSTRQDWLGDCGWVGAMLDKRPSAQ